MLYCIRDIDDPLCSLIKDDPVRPELPLEFRINENGSIFVLLDDSIPSAVICVAYRGLVPSSLEDLHRIGWSTADVAVAYSVWSYRKGAGRQLISELRNWMSLNRPEVLQFVTLSPKSEMAKNFHTANGANIYRINNDTVNWIYD